MNITFPQCKTIMDTLPIGYYAGRRIGIELNEKEATSFYDPMEDKITILIRLSLNVWNRLMNPAIPKKRCGQCCIMRFLMQF